MNFNNVPGSAGQPTLTRRQDGGPITGKSVRSINGGCGFAAQQHPGLASSPTGIGSRGIDLASGGCSTKDGRA